MIIIQPKYFRIVLNIIPNQYQKRMIFALAGYTFKWMGDYYHPSQKIEYIYHLINNQYINNFNMH